MDRRILKRSIRCCRSRDIENDYYLRNLGDPRCEIAGIYVASKKRFEWERFARANLTDKTIQSTLERDAQCPVVNSEIENRKLSFAELTSSHSEYHLAILRRSRNIIVRGNIRLSLRNSLFTDASISVVRIAKFRDLSFSFPRFANNIWHPRYPG